MKGQFVLDCSVTMAWCFQDESCLYSETVLKSLEKGSALVPSLWMLEVANVLLMAQKRKRIEPAASLRFVSLLDNLPLKFCKDPPMKDLLFIGQTYSLTAYDSCYLSLCVMLGLPLATLDSDLKTACHKAGVQLYLTSTSGKNPWI